MKNKWQNEKTLVEKMADDAEKKLDLKKESKAKLFAGLDFNYRAYGLEEKKESSYGSAGRGFYRPYAPACMESVMDRLCARLSSGYSSGYVNPLTMASDFSLLRR
ncbi:MAG: hypothetical protein KJ955_07240 [Nanoarchaeota archaeon]|nr:hypothetical protein [Nanoarchaeota archaeon]